jgi:hypothetical protein
MLEVPTPKPKNRLKKVIIICGLLLGSLIAAYAIWGACENHTGTLEWEKTKAMLEAESVTLDFSTLLPEMPPEDFNFARTPLIAALTDFTQRLNSDLLVYDNPELREKFLEMKLPAFDNESPLPLWTVAKKANLSIAPDISELLEKYKAELAEIDNAALRPEAVLTFDTSRNAFEQLASKNPFLTEMIEFQKFQFLRACKALEAGNIEEAKSALKVCFQLSRTSFSHPTLIGSLIGVTEHSLAVSIIWQGMATNSWKEEDLAWIQNELANQDFLDAFERAFVFEMIQVVSFCDLIKAKSSGSPSSHPPVAKIAPLLPSGIWDHNKSFAARMMLEHSILPIRQRVSSDSTALMQELKKKSVRTFLASITLPVASKIIDKAYHGTVATELAIVACAIERYHLKNGNYPDSLDTLVPEFIEKVPADLMNPENPLQYIKGNSEDRYRIYSIGKNQTDEGGKVALKNGKTAVDNPKEGDWVWGYKLAE